MAAVSFDTLPVDILLSIFAYSPPASVRWCQQVCRSLRDLISTNDYLQYILQLDACGYAEPLHPRTDLGYTEKIRILREHNARWSDPTIVTPVHHELPSYRVVDVDALVKGTFMWCQTVASKDCIRIVFYQLPSTNRGTGFKQWSIDLENEYDGFWIDPEQDLLVAAGARSGWPSPESYYIHLRSMSTNKPHPRAATDLSVLCYTPPSYSWHNGWRIRIYDHLLAGLFHLDVGTDIMIWDWTTGRELTHLALGDDGVHHSFELLSESSFVICRSSHSPDIDRDFPGNTIGWLRIYQFDPQALASTQATHVASFALPDGTSANWGLTLKLHSAPMVSSLGTRSCRGSPAKIYEQTLSDRLLRVDFFLSVLGDFPGLSGSLYVFPSVLLGALPKDAPQGLCQPARNFVAWAEWANCVSWVDHFELHSHQGPQMLGHRLVAQQMQGGTPLPSVCILDFSRQRLMSHGSSALGDIHDSTPATGDTRARATCRKATLAAEGFDSVTIQLPGSPEEDLSTWIDEENGSLSILCDLQNKGIVKWISVSNTYDVEMLRMLHTLGKIDGV
ncbi:hypothetical protein FRC10_000998 [Ceratobasidium sp. 414]|nr:hypothetical protein FRC10_000998 [Ceratobasidium sp. 414]